MAHRPLLIGTGFFVILIGLSLVFAPGAYVRLYVTTFVPGMEFGARRFGPAVLGLGVLLILARDLPPGRFLVSLCTLTGLVFWGVGATGLHALLTDMARPTILVAVAIEAVIGAIFLVTGARLSKSL